MESGQEITNLLKFVLAVRKQPADSEKPKSRKQKKYL